MFTGKTIFHAIPKAPYWYWYIIYVIFSYLIYYRPGNLVQFRAVVVDQRLKPSVVGSIDVSMNDGNGNLIKKWDRVFTTKGNWCASASLRVPIIFFITKCYYNTTKFVFQGCLLPVWNSLISLSWVIGISQWMCQVNYFIKHFLLLNMFCPNLM